MNKNSIHDASDGNGLNIKRPRVMSLHLASSLIFVVLFVVIACYTCVMASTDEIVTATETLIHHPPEPGKASIELTSDEKAWLNAHPVIRVMGEADFPPWDFVESGEATGYGIDYVKLLTDRLGLELQFVIAPYHELIEKATNRELDLLHTITESPRKKILFSKPYGGFFLVAFTRKDRTDIKRIADLAGKRIAVVKSDDDVEKDLLPIISDVNVVEYTGYREILLAVHEEQVDAAILDHAVGDYLIKKHLFRELKAIGEVRTNMDKPYNYMRLGVRSDWPELLALLGKAMDSLTDQEIEALNSKWLGGKSTVPAKQVQLTESERGWLDAHPVIRVGSSPDYVPFNFRISGKPAGYSVDLIKDLAEHLGIDVEFVPELFSKQLEMIKNQELDLLTSVYDIPERSSFLTLTQPYKSADVGIFVRSGQADIRNLEDLAGKTVSLVKGDALATALRKRYPGINQVLASGYFEALRMVSVGTADATIQQIAVGAHIAREFTLSNIKIAGGISAQEYQALGYDIQKYHVGIRHDWPELATILDKTMETVTQEEWRVLDERWLPVSAETIKVGLTPDEKAWLEGHPVIRVASDPDWAPIEFRDQEGKYQGVAIDYLKKIESMLGIRFEFVRENWQELIARAKRQQLDIFPCVAKTPEREKYLLFTDPYIKIPVGIFAREDVAYISDLNKIADEKIAVVEGYATHDYIAANYPDIDLVLVKNLEEGIHSILEEKAFAFIDSVITTGHLISRKGYLQIHLTGEIPFVYAQSMGVRKDWPVFQDILQKAINAIPYWEREAIYNKWVPVIYEKPIDYRLFWQIGAGGLLVIGLIFIWNRKLASEVLKRTLALQDSEKRYHDFFTKSLQGTWCFEMDPPMPTDIPVEEQIEWTLRHLYLEECNDIYATMYGFSSAGEILGFRLVEILGGSEQVAKEVIQAWIDDGYAYSITETRELSKLGEEKWFLNSGLSLIEDGKVVLTMGNQIDITERKHAEETYLKLITAIEQASESFVITDQEASIQYVNPSFEQLTGYTKDEALGKNLRMLMSGKQGEKCFREMWKTLQDGNVWKGHLFNRKKDGSLFEEDATITPIVDGKGKIINYIAVKRDVTDQIKVEKQLQQAQKMEGIGTLAGGIAHDFNNILAAILGYSEMALEAIPAGSKVHADIEQVMKAGNRAKELVKQILTFSRQGDQELQPLRIQLVIKEALKLLRSSIPTTIKINQDLDPDCEVVLADPTQIHQIIMNLCTNAYHAMRETGGILGVSLEPVELTDEDVVSRLNLQPGPYALLEVSDTGHGITEGDRERIFEPYYSTKAMGEGTGLGLAMVHGIITSLRGDVTVSSEPGKGTIFHVYLPIIREGVEIAQEEDTTELPTGNERILFVDDVEDLALLHKMLFEKLGYKVTAMTSSVDTLHAFQEKPGDFDIVITDMTMPNMTGAELSRQILAIRPEMPIILCTGYSDLIDEEKAKTIGIRYFVMKPVITKELANTVRKALDAS